MLVLVLVSGAGCGCLMSRGGAPRRGCVVVFGVVCGARCVDRCVDVLHCARVGCVALSSSLQFILEYLGHRYFQNRILR